MITDAQLDDMLHALGKSHTPERKDMGWRNYYVADGPTDSWEDLVRQGLAEGYSHCNGTTYQVSALGLRILGVTLK